MALEDVIKRARLKENLKQEEAAKLIGVTVQTYSKWENGKTEPKATQVWKLSKMLNISTEEICRGEWNEKMDGMEFMQKLSDLELKINKINFYTAIRYSIKDDVKFIQYLNDIYEGNG